jgi:hypothetical protein
MIEKRKRGRPQGSGKDDGHTLISVARKIVRDDSLKPTTAMWRVINERRDWPATDETLLRRLQVKWRAQGDQYLARARHEMEPARTMTMGELLAAIAPLKNLRVVDMTPTLPEFQEKVASACRGLNAIFASPDVTKAIEALKVLQDRMQVALNSPETKRMIEQCRVYDQRLREITRSPEIEKWVRIAQQFDHTQFKISPEVLALSKPFYYPPK